MAKSRSLVASMLFARRLGEVQLVRNSVAIQRQNRSRHRARAQRTNIQPLAAIVQAIDIAQEHLDVRQQPVRYQHRLGPLQVRVRRHDILARRFGLLHELIRRTQPVAA